MVVNGILKKGEYYDSVSLMIVSKEINKLPGVIESSVVMGTKENLSIIKDAGLWFDGLSEAEDTDLVIALKCEKLDFINSVIDDIDGHLKRILIKDDSAGVAVNPKSLENAIEKLPDANLALISVAGAYAYDEAKKALDANLNVMLFSDNVSIEDEIELKKYAIQKGLLVMGPDCGTAIINGVPLAFANVVKRGNIGIVAAAGTGLQEVSTIISNFGAGISQALGTGGRDIKKDVGGIMFLEGIKALAEDAATEVILLVSKPPAEDVVKKIIKEISKIEKQVVAVFLGAKAALLQNTGINSASTLEEGALKAVAISTGKSILSVIDDLKDRDSGLRAMAKPKYEKLARGQKYLRALFSGGTFCGETQILLQDTLGDIYSNAPSGNSQKLKDSLISKKHTVVDLGEDEFTRGKPHPMIDYSIRNKRILAEAEDPETAVILLDIVLGYGSNMDPLAEIMPVIRKVEEISKKAGRYLPVICSVTGTDEDPQNRTKVVEGLTTAGAIVLDSNAAATKLSGFILENVRE